MKAILVIDVPYITEPCEIDELGLVADMHIRATTMCRYESFDLKEVDVRPLPDRVEEGYPNDEYTIGKAEGRNECLEEIENG